MKRWYYKSQWFYLVIAVGYFSYAMFYYIQNNRKENFILEKHIVEEKHCSAAPRSSSSVQIKKDEKTYTVNLPDEECYNYAVGSRISLYYNTQYDYFNYGSRKRIDNSRIIFTGIILFLVLLPWKYLIGRKTKS